MSTRVYVSSQDCPSNKAKGRNCMLQVGLAEKLASKVVVQVIAQKLVQVKVSNLYSLKLLPLGEFPSQDMQK